MSAPIYTVHQECEDCGETYLPRIEDFDGWMAPEYTACCENCESNRGEAAYERSLSDYYGGSGPVTIAEQHRAAWELKRGLR